MLTRIFGLHGTGKTEALLARLEDCIRQKKQAFLGSIEEKKARLAQLSEEYERIMQEKMPVRLLKAFPNAQSERYNEALEKIREKISAKRKRKAGDK